MDTLGEKEHLAAKAAERDATIEKMRQLMAAMSHTALDAFPSPLRDQLESIALRALRALRSYRRRIWTGNHYTPNGASECARRRRQIAAGSLREANGLVLS